MCMETCEDEDGSGDWDGSEDDEVFGAEDDVRSEERGDVDAIGEVTCDPVVADEVRGRPSPSMT